MRARGCEIERRRGKIEALRRRAREDGGTAAACLLTALGYEESEGDHEHARAYVGALMIIEFMQDLRIIRKALVVPNE